MRLFVSGGVVLAALFTAAPASSRSTSPDPGQSQIARPRHSFFTSNQNRSDVAGQIDRMFKKLDSNHDGFVTKQEIASSEAQFDARAAKSAPKRAAKMFERLDSNHDGQITAAEAETAPMRRAEGVSATPRHRRGSSSLFAKADTNKDGVVTRAEFDAATATGKIKLRHAIMRGAALVRLFDIADANKDGRVSAEEAEQAALQHFDQADLNHDGVLTPDERRQASKAERARRGAV